MTYILKPDPQKACYTHINKGYNDGIADALATRFLKADVCMIVNMIDI